jgi:hypothetical protein
MPPAIIAAGIGAAASIGGGLLASSGEEGRQNGRPDEQHVANQNNALQGQIYDSTTICSAPM